MIKPASGEPGQTASTSVPIVVDASELIKQYSSASEAAVRGISFSVNEGECFGFLGPNGAGKTTTMEMIACRSRRSQGHLAVFGLDPSNNYRKIKAHLGIVPQDANLDVELTVEQNLTIYGHYFGIPISQARRRARELLDFVQLAGRGSGSVRELSGGLKRRLLIVRALVNQPRLLVLDEPTTGLDPQARHLIWDRLGELKRQGMTIVLTTHYMEEAEQLCDRLIIMHAGTILAEGSPSQLIRENVGSEAVEVVLPSRRSATRVAAEIATSDDVGPQSVHVELAGDRIVLYTHDRDALLLELEGRGLLKGSTTLCRNTTLEDVFLKLAGRRLSD